MARRTTLRTYQLAARVWLTAAIVSLLLPVDARLGRWLPLHLVLAGAISVAIAGAMQNFALTLSAAPDARAPIVWTQFWLANLGAALIAVGYPAGWSWLVAVGGTLFTAAAALLGWLVLRARRIGLNRRHVLPFAMYGAAVACVLVGATLGAVIGSGAVDDVETWLALRRAHLILNVLGWVSLTICGTLVTFLPTVLRIRMPPWHGSASGFLLAGGVAAIALGLGADAMLLGVAGGLAYAMGAFGVVWMAAKALRTPRTWPVPVAAKHLVCALGWFFAGAVALPWAIAEGLGGWRPTFLAMFVVGWAVQTLLGAWQYLLPMARPGHPDERRRWLAAMEAGGTLQVLLLNAGVALMALAGAEALPAGAGRAGAILALIGGCAALAKAWTFPALGRVPVLVRRHAETWGA
jgi:nitrite reductase (NO-forming)